MILVSHDPRAISTFCTRAVLLEGGRIVLGDTGERVAEAYLRLLSQPAAPALRVAGGQG